MQSCSICQIGHFPMMYLGMLVSYYSLKVGGSYFIEKKHLKKLDAWIGNTLSM